MLTSATRSRNRVAPHLTATERAERTAPPAPLPVPATPAARQAAYAEAVMAALLTLQAQLRHPDTAVSQAAAVAIVDLEKTRLRHGEPLAGMNAQSERLEDLDRPHGFAATERSGNPNPAPASRGEEKKPVNLADPWERFVDDVWDQMQEEADEHRWGEVISLEQAEERARVLHARMTERAAGSPAPPAGDRVVSPFAGLR